MSIKTQGFRHELKFAISKYQGQIIANSLTGVMQRDPHLIGDSYNIRSLYFDDDRHSCFYENENGVDPREKFRIRIYDCDAGFVRLELKKKQNGLTKKLQCEMTCPQVERVLRGEPLENFGELPPLMKKFELQRMCHLLKPDVVVDYDRIPYIYEMGNVRITFDMNIASSLSFDLFFEKDMPKRPILQQDMMILEVKYDELLPDYIEALICPHITQRTSFSKYYLCRKYSL